MNAPDLKTRIGDSRVGLRPDLEFSRQLFRGRVCYVIHDPVTFASHRVSLHDYRVLIALRSQRTLTQCFETLVRRGHAAPEHEADFYQFVVSMHQAGFVQLPIADGDRLYQSYVRKRRRTPVQRMLSSIFIRVPLINPDRWLHRYLAPLRALFSMPAFLIWTATVVSAIAIGSRQWSDFKSGFDGFLGLNNLVYLWLTIIILKVFHEFGHAIACKAYGGLVPEMGAYFIALTPCAYVDATSSWGFPSKYQRIVVCLAGMYVEVFISALALLAWTAVPDGTGRTLLHNVVTLGSIVTIGFNVNPLMRFDGYYVMMDLLEIPNLRTRASGEFKDFARRWLLGIRSKPSQLTTSVRAALVIFGVGCVGYRVLVVLGLSTMLAMKFFLLGVLVGGIYIGGEVTRATRRAFGYLWFAAETRPVRGRAVVLSVIVLAGIGALLFWVPIPGTVYASGVVESSSDNVIRVTVPGYLESVEIVPGQFVANGERVARLDDDETQRLVDEAKFAMLYARAQLDASEFNDTNQALRFERELARQRSVYSTRSHQLEELDVRSDVGGRVVECLRQERIGSYLRVGEPVARIIDGAWRVRVVLDRGEVATVEPRVGDAVELRLRSQPDRVIDATIVAIQPTGTRRFDKLGLTETGGGRVVVDPATQQSRQLYFQLTVEIDADADFGLEANLYGMTAVVRMSGDSATLGVFAWRRMLTFANRLILD